MWNRHRAVVGSGMTLREFFARHWWKIALAVAVSLWVLEIGPLLAIALAVLLRKDITAVLRGSAESA